MDDNNLILKDADAESSNRYIVRILGDAHDALNVTYSTLPIEVFKGVPYTAIVTSESSSATKVRDGARFAVLERSLVCCRNFREDYVAAKISLPRDPPSAGRTSAPGIRRGHGEHSSFLEPRFSALEMDGKQLREQIGDGGRQLARIQHRSRNRDSLNN